LSEQHGAEPRTEVNRLLSLALTRREKYRALVMLRVRSAVASLQTPPSGPLHRPWVWWRMESRSAYRRVGRMRWFFVPEGSLSRLTIEIQALKTNLLGARSVPTVAEHV